MRRLFFRIFMSYWLATGLVLAMAVATTSWVAWQRLRAFDELEPALLAEQADVVLASGGIAALRNWTIEKNSRITSPNIFVLDTQGHDLIGRPVGPMLVHRAELAAVTVAAGKPWNHWPRFTAMIAGPNGEHFLLVLTTGASGPLSAFGNVKILITLVFLSLAVVGLVCWAVARTVSRPVVRLQASVQALAAGDLSVRVGPEITRRSDELGALGRDFDVMAEKLRVMLASKEALMRDLSHELRSPLARLRVALGLARANQSSFETQFARIERESERMDGLIGQLLRLSRLMSVELRPELAEIDLSMLVSEIVDDARLEASGSARTIVWEDPGEIVMDLDGEMMRQAIENVLRNALRFSPPDGQITVTLRALGGRVSLLVQDQGPGVPEAELARIFEPFYRAQNSEGTGVGLAITARVMALHGGEVMARNGSEHGLEVEFLFPGAPKSDQTPAAAAAADRG